MGNLNKRLPVLMTASISTRGMKGACFTDMEREDMYAEALSYYIQHLLSHDTSQRIVFAENSGWDLRSLKQKLPTYDKSRIEFISLNPEYFDISKGKGYNELLLINKAIELSDFIQETGAFFKVTGRYPIFNLAYFIKKASDAILNRGIKLYADMKDHNLYEYLQLGWCGKSFECRLFGVDNEYYNMNIAPLFTKCNDYQPIIHQGGGKLLEAVLYDFVKANPSKDIILRFKREPHFGGIEGSDINAISFSKNQDSLKGNMKRAVGNCIRIFLPFFKF